MVLKKTDCFQVQLVVRNLSSLSTDSSGQLDVLGHDGDTLGMDGTQVGVLKQTNQISLTGLLESHDSRALESQVSLEVLGNFSHQTLEGQLPDQELGAMLVSPNLSQGDSSRLESVRLLDHFLHLTTSGGHPDCGLGGALLASCLLLGKLLHPWSHSSCGLARGLLSSNHVYLKIWV